MFRTERQRELSHFVAELKCIIAERCIPEITDEEINNIIQNGTFVGAVTHVIVQSPTRGYAVFGDLMVKQMKSSN